MKFFLCCFLFLGSLYAAPVLKIEPSEAMLNEEISVCVEGVGPNSEVKLVATTQDEKGRRWKSEAIFVSDEAGRVDLRGAAPVEGSYQGVDPMGLFWSMRLEKGEKDGTVFRHVKLDPLTIGVVAQLEGNQILQGKVVRKVGNEGLIKEAVCEESLTGNLLCPPGEGPFPAVIVLGGSNGGIPADSYLAQLANEGYAAFGLAYYRAPGVSQYLENIPVEYVERAIEWMKKQKKLSCEKLAIVGTSMGGSYALLAASYFPAIKAAVVFDGSGVVFGALDSEKKETMSGSAFSYQKKPISFIPLKFPEVTEMSLRTPLFLRLFLSSLFEQPKEVVEAAAIKVERIHGPVLLMGSLDDKLFASAFLLQESYNRLCAHRFPFPYEFVTYKGVGHMLGLAGLPYCPTTSCQLKIMQNGILYEVGGNPKDTAEAQVDSWRRAIAFLQKYVQKSIP